jgi:hypothetical protein
LALPRAMERAPSDAEISVMASQMAARRRRLPPRQLSVCYVSFSGATPEVDTDRSFLVDALEAEGVSVTVENWSARSVRWGHYDALWVRSTWNYHLRIAAFLRWVAAAESIPHLRLMNPAPVLRANSNKGYLLQLRDQGVPIPRTAVVAAAADVDSALAAAAGWGAAALVTKPAVGAAALGVRKHAGLDAARAALLEHFAQLKPPEQDPNSGAPLANGLLLQPFEPGFDQPGEVAIICCEGRPLHAVRKRSVLTHGGHGDFDGNVALTPELAGIVEQVARASLGGVPIGSLL